MQLAISNTSVDSYTVGATQFGYFTTMPNLIPMPQLLDRLSKGISNNGFNPPILQILVCVIMGLFMIEKQQLVTKYKQTIDVLQEATGREVASGNVNDRYMVAQKLTVC